MASERMNLTEIQPGEKIEVLIGGPCDGLVTAAPNQDYLYVGRKGDGIVNVYERQSDGRLHYVRSYAAGSANA